MAKEILVLVQGWLRLVLRLALMKVMMTLNYALAGGCLVQDLSQMLGRHHLGMDGHP